jgi:GTP-binding protein EngB required for normal cell division
LAADNVETQLALDYETIRRREYELITRLLDVLPRVDNLPEDRLAQVRDALFHADHPFLMVFVGPFSSGKSSIINALLGQSDLLPVGPVPTTDRISILRWGEQPEQMSAGGDVQTVFHPSPLLKKVSFVDTPGLESVFQRHEETTRRFLHRSDVVLLVMLATQAMTARNLEYLQTLREYGKKVIIVINQVDLLTPEEAESVRTYVLEQSQSHLGYKPDVWLVSARKGLEARDPAGELVDPLAWEASGLTGIEDYVDEQLSDVARLRQKLQTPLQITQNVSHAALAAVQANQAALDQYQGIAENVEQQLAAQKRDLERIVREINAEIEGKFGAAALRGGEALRERFQFSRALSSIGRGVLELVGLAGLLRRRDAEGYVRAAFEQHKAFDPVNELSAVVDKLGPRLEGKDMQDMDDLVKYARHEVEGLPPNIREKVIGSLQAPMQYDRAPLQQVRPDLEAIENEARTVETRKLEQTMRNTLLYLAVFEILIVVFAIFILAVPGPILADQPQSDLLALVVLALLGVTGLAFMPLRGRFLQTSHTNRLLKLQSRYIETLSRAADKQLEYGMQLRRDAIAPLTRLIEAQTTIQKEQLSQLQSAEQEMVSIEAALTALGKKRLLGIGGE